MNRRTKVVCTIGPAVDAKDKIQALIDAGMNVARLNCSHGDWPTRHKWIGWLRELGETSGVGILVDLQGPKFRIGEVAGGCIHVRAGKELTIGPGSGATVPVNQPEIVATLDRGCRILIADGEVELQIIEKSGENFTAKIVSSGEIKSHQGITLVGKVFDTPCVTDKDLKDLAEAAKAKVDFVALSYVHSADDLRKVREILSKQDSSIAICAKVETRQAVEHIDAIIEASDIVMVARGDMGLQMDIEDVPIAQKRIIERCMRHGKPVITATQMLESMTHSPRPTRAEATDVANAILDGTDAVMLSGETANGQYPLECVKTMVRIAEKAEGLLDREKLANCLHPASEMSHTEAVAFAVNELAKVTKPKAIITTTTSGQTARLVSKFRPHAQILCATWKERTRYQMSVVWGVQAEMVEHPEATDESLFNSITMFVKKGRLRSGDHVILTAGVPAGVPGNTNLILTQKV